MADNYLITGYWGEPHVTAENDRGINAAIFGPGRFVLPVGRQFNAEYIGNNTVRMYDGKLMNNGAAAGIPAGRYVDLLIPEAGQGMNRNDLIVFQYSLDSSTLVESGNFVVISGTETSGTATDPTLTQADLLTNEATLDQYALWRVKVSSTIISAPEKLFSVYQNNVTHAADKNNPHGVTKAQVGLSNVPNVTTNDQTPTFTDASTLSSLISGEKMSVAFGKIAKAISHLISHTHNYAGSSSAGGAATSANKLNANAGSATQPVYFSNGVPVATTYTLGKSVPSNAVFTDTVYTLPGAASTSLGGVKINYIQNNATITTSTSHEDTGVSITVPANSWYICSACAWYNASNPTRITVIGSGTPYGGNTSSSTSNSLTCCFANYASSAITLSVKAAYATAASNRIDIKCVYFQTA